MASEMPGGEVWSDPVESARAEPRRVVVAEDDDEIRHGIVELLVRDGFDVTCVSDGERLFALLERLARERRAPHVIVTDHRMPGRTGLDLLAELRDSPTFTPVIVMTAFGGEVREAALALGACAIFDKPFDPDDLRTAVMYWSRRGRRRDTRRGGWALPSARERDPDVD
jgi:CheY-like chemotaxis protein